MIVAKTFEFDAAHRLPHHMGKCKNVHGHRYQLTIQVAGEINIDKAKSDYGMVKDFGDFAPIRERINTNIDHAYIATKGDPIAVVCESEGLKVYYLDETTTVEHLAQHLHQVLQSFFPIHAIQLYETPTSYCIYP